MEVKPIRVFWGGQTETVWVARHFDDYLDTFAADVGGALTADRCPFGVLLWPAARALAAALAEQAPFARQRQLRIVDLGCGVGFLACVVARLFPAAEVWACDYEAELAALVSRNAHAWGVEQRVHFQTLDWRADLPPGWAGSFDWVLGSDVFYDDSHIEGLPQCVQRLLVEEGILTLADPQRYRFRSALVALEGSFTQIQETERACPTVGEGMEDFMVTRGVVEQRVRIVELRKRPQTLPVWQSVYPVSFLAKRVRLHYDTARSREGVSLSE